MNMNNHYDIIIVGGGGSGLAAAVSAAEQGASVLLLEQQAELGGTTGIAVGSFTANRTRYQQRAGIEDSVEDHEEDAGKFAAPEIEARNFSELRRFFLSHTADTLAWLSEMGLKFHGPSPEPPNRVPRMHNVIPGAKAYIATLQSRFLKLGGTIQCGAEVTKLLKEGERVTGVEASIANQLKPFQARLGVILAAGDYANSSELIERFKGTEYSGIEGINPRALGDGHLLAEQVGAKLLNMEITYGPELRFISPARKTFQQLLPTSGLSATLLGKLMPMVPNSIMNRMIKRLLVTWQHPENRLFDSGAILINQAGQRFCEERIWPDREIAVANQPGKISYILMDERLINQFSTWPNFISTAPEIAYAYVKDYLKLRPDVAIQKSSLSALAEAREIPVNALEETVRQYNTSPETEQPLQGKQWVLLGPAKAYFTTTEGGVAINQQFESLDEQGDVIPGLYAIGQNGLGGQILWGHGLHIAWAMTSGRLAGQQLAQSRST